MNIFGVHPVEELIRSVPDQVVQVRSSRWDAVEIKEVRALCDAAGIRRVSTPALRGPGALAHTVTLASLGIAPNPQPCPQHGQNIHLLLLQLHGPRPGVDWQSSSPVAR